MPEFLNQAYDDRDPRMTNIRVNGDFGFLHDDPQFKELLRRLNLPE